jgi:hypothetical protein
MSPPGHRRLCDRSFACSRPSDVAGLIRIGVSQDMAHRQLCIAPCGRTQAFELTALRKTLNKADNY